MSEMKIEIVEKWFKLNETLTREQYETLGSMYDIILDIAIVEANNCKQITPIVSDQTKKDIEEVEKPSSEIPGVVKPNDIWTEDEDEIIKKYYPVMSTPAIKLEKLPHRSKQAIYDRAYFLKIKKSKPRVQTKKDIEDHKKLCNKCQTVKPIEEFHKNKRSNDGLQPHCKECKKKYYTKDKHDLQEPTEQEKEEIIDWSFKEENLLREKGFKIGFDKLLKLLPGRSEQAIQKKMQLMGMAL